jgi:hypothetical protein
MRRTGFVVTLVLVVLASCSSSETSTTVTSAAVAGSTTMAPGSTIAPGSTQPATTAAPSTVASSAAAPAPLVPEVVCVSISQLLTPGRTTATTTGVITTAAPDAAVPTSVPVSPPGAAAPALNEDDRVVFGYSNQAGRAVTVPSGERNSLSGDAPDDDPLVPVAFAPGRVERAFVAYVGPDASVPAWRLTGPDGVTRTATPTAATPTCGPEQLDASKRGPGEPSLAYSYRSVPGAGGIPTGAELRVWVAGLPALSTCPAGLTPLPPVARIAAAAGPTVAPGEPIAVARSGPRGGAYLEAHVADVCQADGVRSATWALGSQYDALREGTPVCFVFDDLGASLVVGGEPGCQKLPATGGVRARRVTIAP